MQTPTTFRINVLDDNCSPIDLTADHTHLRIAEKLHELINDANVQGLTVGLEGEWGSGKSTVVELLRRKLMSDPNTFVFYIDAWEHEGDHLRRVFLESLIAKLKAWKTWEEDTIQNFETILDRVTARKTETTITRKSQASKFGRDVGIATLLVPVGSVLLQSSINQITYHWTGTICWKFWIGLICMLAPISRFGFRWIRNWFRTEKLPYNLLETEAKEDTTLETSREEERSSVEFGKYFDQIVHAAGCKLDNLILVLDNLDRIDPKDALRIWSTLQTFVQHRNPVEHKKTKPRLWIIVPYAHDSLSKLWEDPLPSLKDNDNSQVGQNKSPSKRKLAETTKTTRADSFIDKSFQLRLHVPKMIISGWQEFARVCIKQAFPDMDECDRKTVLTVLDWTRENIMDAPSPRQIKIYVNEVGLAYSMNQHNISLSAICLYVVKKYLQGMSNTQLEKELQDGKITQTSLPEHESTRVLSAEIAALLYGVSEAKAMEILLGPIILSALTEGKTALLTELRKIHDDAFDSVLSFVFRLPDMHFICPKCASIVQIAFRDPDSSSCRIALHAIRTDKESAIAAMSNLPSERALALIELSKQDPILENELVSSYITSLPNRMQPWSTLSKEKSPDTVHIDTPADFFSHYESLRKTVGKDVKIPYKAITSENLEFFQKFSSEDIQKLVPLLDNSEQIDDDIAKAVKAGTPIDPIVEKVFSAFVVGGLATASKTAKAVKSAFEWNNGTQQGQVFSQIHFRFIRALLRLQSHGCVVPELMEMLKGSGLWNCWRQQRKFDEVNATMIHLVETHFPGMPKREIEQNGVSWGAVNELRMSLQTPKAPFAQNLYALIRDDNRYDWLRKEASMEPMSHGLLAICLIVSLALKNKDQKLFDPERPYATLLDLNKCINGDQVNNLFDLFCSDETRFELLSNAGSFQIENHPEEALRLIQAIPDGAPFKKDMENKCAKELNAIGELRWKQDFSDQPKLCSLVEHLVQQGTDSFMDNSFCNSFTAKIQETIKTQITWKITTERLNLYYQALKPDFRKVFNIAISEAVFSNGCFIATDIVKDFILSIPDYAPWLNTQAPRLPAVSTSLASPNKIKAFSNLLDILSRFKNTIENWQDIGVVISKPVLDMTRSPSTEVCDVAAKAVSLFGLNLSDAKQTSAK